MPNIPEEIILILWAFLEKSGQVLEEKVLKMFGKRGCDIFPDRIEACHLVGRTTDAVIVKFSKQKV